MCDGTMGYVIRAAETSFVVCQGVACCGRVPGERLQLVGPLVAPAVVVAPNARPGVQDGRCGRDAYCGSSAVPFRCIAEHISRTQYVIIVGDTS